MEHAVCLWIFLSPFAPSTWIIIISGIVLWLVSWSRWMCLVDGASHNQLIDEAYRWIQFTQLHKANCRKFRFFSVLRDSDSAGAAASDPFQTARWVWLWVESKVVSHRVRLWILFSQTRDFTRSGSSKPTAEDRQTRSSSSPWVFEIQLHFVTIASAPRSRLRSDDV